jgi:hypothetical protein
MRAKSIIASLLGLFVVLAIVMVAKDARAPKAPVPQVVAASAIPAGALRLPAVAPDDPLPPDATVDSSKSEPAVGTARQAASTAERAAPPVPVAAREKTTAQPAHVRKVVATYFHGNVRCVTCRKVEAYAQEAVQDAFEQQIAAGTVEFRAVNVEEDANRHFIQDYQLVSKTLVVTEEVDGAVARWAKLDDVWTLVNDRTAFFRYVQGGVRNYVVAQ